MQPDTTPYVLTNWVREGLLNGEVILFLEFCYITHFNCRDRVEGISMREVLRIVLEEMVKWYGVLYGYGWMIRVTKDNIDETIRKLGRLADSIVSTQDPCDWPIVVKLVSPDREAVVRLSFWSNWILENGNHVLKGKSGSWRDDCLYFMFEDSIEIESVDSVVIDIKWRVRDIVRQRTGRRFGLDF